MNTISHNCFWQHWGHRSASFCVTPYSDKKLFDGNWDLRWWSIYGLLVGLYVLYGMMKERIVLKMPEWPCLKSNMWCEMLLLQLPPWDTLEKTVTLNLHCTQIHKHLNTFSKTWMKSIAQQMHCSFTGCLLLDLEKVSAAMWVFHSSTITSSHSFTAMQTAGSSWCGIVFNNSIKHTYYIISKMRK